VPIQFHADLQKQRCNVPPTVEGLILLKACALPSLYRTGDFVRVGLYENDLATLIQAYRPDVAHLLSILGNYRSASDLDKIRSIMDEVVRRIARFDDRQADADAPAVP
jgi:hypothetical protein